ncbi:MAG: fructosamine kinase family protein [Flavitalea sp.]
MNSAFRSQIQEHLSKLLNSHVDDFTLESIHGGSINDVFRLETDQNFSLCCKINDAPKFPGMFAAEKAGLELLDAQKIFRVPKVYGHTIIENKQLLFLEWIGKGKKTKLFWQKFGERLSELHSINTEQFGSDHNNYMGALSQSNRRHKAWSAFFLHERIVPQVKLAIDAGLLQASCASSIGKLSPILDSMFGSSTPALVHGDLWNGNFLCDDNDEPVLIDPAVYFGHPSVDLGLTTLFGGYDKQFYEAYHHLKPFTANYQEQWEICNLYPLLIHLNLFGSGYLPDVLAIMRKYGIL